MIENLEIQKEDAELVIQRLKTTALKFEDFIKDNALNEELKGIFKSSLNEINKEVEWNEIILQEIDDGINFELGY